MGGGIDEIRLFQNGKVVAKDSRSLTVKRDAIKKVSENFNVSLLEGENVFRAVAFSKDRTESRPYELTINLVAPAKDATLHLVVVGINQYMNSDLNLNYAVPDAKGIVDYFQKKGSNLFRAVNVIQLYDAEATRENILKTFQTLKEKAQPQDLVIFYFAGHGDNRAEQWYFIPHEVTQPELTEEISVKGISSDTISEELRQVRSLKVLLLLDSCKSGTALASFRGYEDRKAMSQLARSSGVHIIASTTPSQNAVEVSDLGHGVFTYLLLKGLSGEAASKSAGSTVSVYGLISYINAQLPVISQKYRAGAQYPVVKSNGMDFPLSVIP